MITRAYYTATVRDFLSEDTSHILGELSRVHVHALEQAQKNAWIVQIGDLRNALSPWPHAYLLLEYSIPRMGRRADAVLLLEDRIFVLEFKVGARAYDGHAIDQVLDYALDLKNFHEGSHDRPIVPVLVATDAPTVDTLIEWGPDDVAWPARANRDSLQSTIAKYTTRHSEPIEFVSWLESGYRPTPTIVEAARALYVGHRVEDISRSDAGAYNLTRTADAISRGIEATKRDHGKTIFLVTGVPGSGKTLAGLNLATQRMRLEDSEHAVFLSGNGPLVSVLREALTRDDIARSKEGGANKTRKSASMKADAFIQNIHHFRDEYLRTSKAPIEQVVVFDEAQRAWTREHASRFMREKRQTPDFEHSEPEFLLSVMDRHEGWCSVVCLIGSGQEINTGEAGLAEWLAALSLRFRHWRVIYSDRIPSSQSSSAESLRERLSELNSEVEPALHLATNVRSFRAEQVSDFVAAVLHGDASAAQVHASLLTRYPIVLTRSLDVARNWLRDHARGTERYGLVASSNGIRLKPVGLHVKAKIEPVYWFLNGKDDVRSSYALEDVASEFDVQGLELDWVGVCWDANLRYVEGSWSTHRFSGTQWKAIRDPLRMNYLFNAYRVLLTRARQGMVVYVPEGEARDATRIPKFYDGTFAFLRDCGATVLT